ncbi:MAG TPA: NAD(P)-dependent oxidoreductase [Holophagaceae bacterium]|nr:NAD(P)-dependent oxidoreductase [Holophagaceae bacterium]
MILVTGGTGLTGRFVVDELLWRGQAVRVLCRREVSTWAGVPGVETALGDLGDPGSLARAARGASGIVHAACTYTDGPADLAAMAALLGSWRTGPFIFISSLDVYGFSASPLITEDTPLCEGYNDYSDAKIRCERMLGEAAHQQGRSDFAMLRAPYIWGPHATAAKRLVARRLLDHAPIILPGADRDEWSRYRDVWVDVRDLAVLVAECLARPAGGPLNVLSGHFVWHDLYEMLIRLTGSRSGLVHKPIEAITDDELPNKQLYAQSWRFSEARLSESLGIIPRRSLEATVRDTVLHGSHAALP